ncbi:hypothetical protein V9T40_012921 [Parthenolecanium corni]|uniref:Uncharacterized protein n=1 Tax=Parthenolecanium corni TaxID=536013 RepID=A0AAN9T8M5_9HEMI
MSRLLGLGVTCVSCSVCTSIPKPPTNDYVHQCSGIIDCSKCFLAHEHDRDSKETLIIANATTQTKALGQIDGHYAWDSTLSALPLTVQCEARLTLLGVERSYIVFVPSRATSRRAHRSQTRPIAWGGYVNLTENYVILSSSCRIPRTDPYDNSIKKYLFKWKPLICSDKESLTLVEIDPTSGRHLLKVNSTEVNGGETYCMGQIPQIEDLFQYMTEFVQRFHNRRYFNLIWANSFSHSALNMPSVMDDRIRQFHENIEDYLNSTVVIFYSDHGMRFGEIKRTHVGWLEERMPFIYFYLPPSFKTTYPRRYQNLLANKNKLTSPYDLYATLQHILYG